MLDPNAIVTPPLKALHAYVSQFVCIPKFMYCNETLKAHGQFLTKPFNNMLLLGYDNKAFVNIQQYHDFLPNVSVGTLIFNLLASHLRGKLRNYTFTIRHKKNKTLQYIHLSDFVYMLLIPTPKTMDSIFVFLKHYVQNVCHVYVPKFIIKNKLLQ